MNKKLRIIWFILVLFAINFKAQALGVESNGESPLFMSLGRLHPVILHLPIGMLILTFITDIWGRFKSNYPSETIGLGLGFSAITALLTSIFGYILSLEEGYTGDVLDLHLKLGIITTVMSFVLFALHRVRHNGAGWLYLPVFLLTLGALIATGHYGSILTHGDDFLTEHIRSTASTELIEEVDSLEIYTHVIAKIMDDKCVKCHNSTKKKGDLSLISQEMIFKGGENGEVLVAGNPDMSPLYTNALLPLHHDAHMPPEGKKQLTKKELRLLKYWIENGASFEAKVNELTTNDSINKMLEAYLINEKRIIEPADLRDIEKVRENGFRVHSIIPGQGDLSVKYLHRQLQPDAINSLKSLKGQIVELDLGNTNLSDSQTRLLRKFTNLKKIKLNNTHVGDATLKNLEELAYLEVLNLYDTEVTFDGLDRLLEHINPRQIYIWNSKVDSKSAALLADKYQVGISSGVFEGFVEMAMLRPPVLLNEESLFTDEVEVVLSSKMKGATIRYSLDGKEPDSLSNLYSAPLKLQSNTELKAKVFKSGWHASEALVQNFEKVKHRIDSFSLVDQPEIRYPGASKLFDFKQGSDAFKDGRWTGYLGYDLNVTIYWPEDRSVRKVAFNCLENIGNWIMMPTDLEIYASEQARTGFKKVGAKRLQRNSEQQIKAGDNKEPVVSRFELEIEETKARYFKIVVKNPRVLPSWHPGAGNPSWIFIDEVILW